MTCVYLTQCGRFTATHHHGGTLCEGPHTHTFTFEATFYGPLNAEGYLIDFRILQDFFAREITARLNGTDLNTLLEKPTTEHLAMYLARVIAKKFPQLCKLQVNEEPDRWVIVENGGTVCPKP